MRQIRPATTSSNQVCSSFRTRRLSIASREPRLGGQNTRMRTPIRRFAFQGEPGAFSHAAALKLLGPRAKPLPCTSFKDVFQALETGTANCAVVPIENTLHGSIH